MECEWKGRVRRGGGLLGLAAFAFAVAGYHPFAEDGGVYAAGVKWLLRPELYPTATEFVTEHLRFSVFARVVAALVRGTHLPLEWVLLGLYFGGIWATLVAGWMVASRCVAGMAGRWGAVGLLACWLTLPIAGTSLMLMDPYVTARTFTTPLLLAALAWALDLIRGGGWRAGLLCGGALVAAAALHPLMAGYGAAAVAFVLVLGAEDARVRRWGPWGLVTAAVGLAGMVQALAPAESAAYVRVAATRYYWFPARWEWFEWLGLVGPVVVLVWLKSRRCWSEMGNAAVWLAAISFAVAALFAREGLATHLVARMQPLRCFQTVYEVMILLLGAWLGETLLARKLWRWVVLFAGMGGVMAYAQRQIYAHSAHMEWPGMTPQNAWQQAFLWVRGNTPVHAVFAMDARYITRGKGEDAQCFRAIAERSALPDYSKDGGEAAITPALVDAWVAGQSAQGGLDVATDAERAARLRPLGADWVVLGRSSQTGWACPYVNQTVEVCRVGRK